MMKSAEPTEQDSLQRAMPDWLRFVLIALCVLGAITSAGFCAGLVGAGIEFGFAALTYIYLAAGLAVTIGGILIAWRLAKSGFREAVAPSVQKNRNIVVIALVVGCAIGLALSIANMAAGTPDLPLGNGPLPPIGAAIAIAIWLIAVPLLTWRWINNIDEHEAQANNAGAMAALMFYLTITPCWWVGWRGGLLPEPESMIIFLAVTAVYCAVWAWRRYR